MNVQPTLSYNRVHLVTDREADALGTGRECLRRHMELITEREAARDRVFELLEELEVAEILRAHIAPTRRYLVDRFESTIRLLDRIDRDLAGVAP
jgi:hypothetical protein